MNLLIISFWFGQLNRYCWPGTLLGRVNLLDLAVALIMVIFIWRRQQLKLDSLKLNPWLLGFISISLFSAIWGFSLFQGQGQPESLMYLLRLIIYGVWFGAVGAVFKREAYYVGMVIGVGVAVLGWIQLIVMPNISTRLAETAGFDPHSGRLFSTFFDPNYTAIVLAMTSIMTLALIWQSKNKAKLYPLLGIQLLALLQTNSRSGLLALVIGLIIFLGSFNWRYVLITLITGGGIVLFIPSIATRLGGALALDKTTQARFASWETATMVIRHQPILGIGYNNYQMATTAIGRFQPRIGQIALAANASDSSLLTVWATTGIFGLILLIGWLLNEAASNGHGAQFGPAQLAARRAIIAALLVNSWFLNSLLWPFGLFLLAMVLTPMNINKSTPK